MKMRTDLHHWPPHTYHTVVMQSSRLAPGANPYQDHKWPDYKWPDPLLMVSTQLNGKLIFRARWKLYFEGSFPKSKWAKMELSAPRGKKHSETFVEGSHIPHFKGTQLYYRHRNLLISTSVRILLFYIKKQMQDDVLDGQMRP